MVKKKAKKAAEALKLARKKKRILGIKGKKIKLKKNVSLKKKLFKKRVKLTEAKKSAKQKKKRIAAVSFKKTFLTKQTGKERKKTAHKTTIRKTTKKQGENFNFQGIHKTKIRIIGIGGGGSAIVSEIYSRIKKADFYVANTDVQALREAPKGVKKFQFGQNLTHGFGTGMNVEIGEAAAQEEKEKIEKILKGQDLCIIISALGGGASSGAAPVFAKISKNLGNITYGIFTLPFKFEGEKKMEAALNSLEKVKSSLNVYTVIPNERIFQVIDKDTPLKDALSIINKKLAENLGGLIEMIYMPGLINIDFADLKTILSGRGRLSYLNTIESEEEDKEEMVRKLISSPLSPYAIKGAKGILYNIISGKNIQLLDVSKISNAISQSAGKNVKIIFGISQNDKESKKIKITLFAAGCSSKGFLTKPSVKTVSKSKTAKKKRKLSSGRQKRPAIKDIERKKEMKGFGELSQKAEKKSSKKLKPKLEPPAAAKEKRALLAPPQTKKTEEKDKKRSENEMGKKTEGESGEKVSETSRNSRIPVRINLSEDKKIRKNALQVKKEIQEEGKEILEGEEIWNVPAILRKKQQL